MKFVILSAVASALVGSVAASSCTYADGYTYCDETDKFIYKNVGFSGSYTNVVSMNEDSTAVSYETAAFSGSLSPFDEELSVHVRGPITFKEFGVYYPSSGSSNKKRDDDEDCSTTKHLHHQHVKRATKIVTQTMYVNEGGEPITKTVALADDSESAETTSADTKTAATSASTSSSTLSSTSSASAGDWVRSSHWTPGSTSNLTVLNNYGGGGSGVWSSTWGNSLSYANSDNLGAASEATALEEVTLLSISEFSLWSGLECDDSSEEYSCGYYRPDSVAYHAFAGAEKIMVFSFTMPSDTDSSSSSSTGYDMPAIWLLNAKIPRIGQYLDISCWTSGCGELDLFEVLVNDYDKMVTALHDKQGTNGGGSSDYISRPYDSVMKAVVLFYEGEIHIQTVDSDFEFESTLSSEQVSAWTSVDGSDITLSS